MEANAAVGHHRYQMKNDSADCEACKDHFGPSLSSNCILAANAIERWCQ